MTERTPQASQGCELRVGDVIGQRQVVFTRQTLLDYAAASGDANPIHRLDEAATAVGLPGVIAHGMLTMGTAIQLVVDWAGDPGAVIDYEVRFARPVPVPREGQAELEVSGTVHRLDPAAEAAVISLNVTQGETKVLAKARATVRWHPGPDTRQPEATPWR
ncbi:MAG: 3-hydroxyacyl-ACP dehydratase [Bifidobacteriaceae bacterium]|jgi:acyl dehydratase|nr:3-hydroxyacyl-ACP dehydratase [Bifidobacteriaceae bacterium]